jgi:DNA-binding CsgD family transcriptional regulator
MAVRAATGNAAQPGGAAWTSLSKREREVAEWLVEGKTNIEMAAILAVTESTIRKHLEHIFVKLDVSNRATAIRVLLAGSVGATLDPQAPAPCAGSSNPRSAPKRHR